MFRLLIIALKILAWSCLVITAGGFVFSLVNPEISKLFGGLVLAVGVVLFVVLLALNALLNQNGQIIKALYRDRQNESDRDSGRNSG